MAYQYAYVMKGLSKTYPGAPKPAFKDVTLSFLPGAKIAIIGPNGAGKSTLMKVIAGIDKEFIGEAWAAEGITVGYLPQEPQLDSTKDVRGNVMDGVRPVAVMMDALQRHLRRNGRPARIRYRFRQADGGNGRSCRNRSTRSTAGRSTTSSRSPWTRCVARRPIRPVDKLVRR